MRRLPICLLFVIFNVPLHAENTIDAPVEPSPKQELFRHWVDDVLLPLTHEPHCSSRGIAISLACP
jgi:hypothetical protein